jgi:trehalose 6-phosphate phosphatase
VEFADAPEAVIVTAELRETLADLSGLLDGALALVSGRSIASLDGLLGLPLALAGNHGAQWRDAKGAVKTMALVNPAFAQVRSRLLAFAARHGLIAEDKNDAVAIHYRQHPHLQPQLEAFIANELALDDSPELRVIRGNCVYEVQPSGVDKGVAIARFMQGAPFKGRRPIYIGDDTTDEDGFAWVNAEGGVSIKVGQGPSCAQQRLAGTGEVLAFLQSQRQRLRQSHDQAKPRTGADW